MGISSPPFVVFTFFGLFGTIFGSQASPLSKANFCQSLSSCRQRAQLELAQCAGGVLPALAAKQGEMVVEMDGGRRCMLEMNRTIGGSMGRLYERIEKRALKCAEQHAIHPRSAFNRDEILRCKAIHLDFLVNFSSPFDLLALRGQQLEDPTGPQECLQLYNAHLLRCDALNKCCPELESCLQSIEEEIEMRSKENRVLKLLDKCMNEIPIKSGEVEFVERMANDGQVGKNESRKEKEEEEEKGAENVDDNNPVPVPIVGSPTSSFSSTTSSPPPPTSDSSTLLPPPDPTMRDFFDFFFPGLAINGGKKNWQREDNKGKEYGGKEGGGGLVEFVLDKVEMGRTNLGNLVDRVMAKKGGGGRNGGGGGGGRGLVEGKKEERGMIVKKEEEGGNALAKMQHKGKAAAANSALEKQSSSEKAAFVIESNSVVSEEDEEEEGNSAENNDDIGPASSGNHPPHHFSTTSSDSFKTSLGTEPPANGIAAPSTKTTITNGTNSPLLAYPREERQIAMAVGRIFCAHYSECVEAKMKLGANCPGGGGQQQGEPKVANPNWFGMEQMEKCLEARPLKLLVNAYGSPSNFCAIAEEFEKNCRLMRECCPSIV